MKISEAIAEVDNLKPNMYGTKDKIKWLSRLDARIYQEIVQTHERNEGEEDITFTPYTENDTDKELLVAQPYDEIYVRWLEAQIDYSKMEYDSFNNSNAMFEAVFTQFRNAHNRCHKPKGETKIYY